MVNQFIFCLFLLLSCHRKQLYSDLEHSIQLYHHIREVSNAVLRVRCLQSFYSSVGWYWNAKKEWYRNNYLLHSIWTRHICLNLKEKPASAPLYIPPIVTVDEFNSSSSVTSERLVIFSDCSLEAFHASLYKCLALENVLHTVAN